MTSVLCHIGLAKCASTTLQNSWHRSSNYYGYFSQDLVSTVRDSVGKNRSDLPQFKQLLSQNRMSENAFSDVNASYVVISNESMTDSGVTDASDPQLARDVQDCIAISLEACVDRVLIMVRDPLSWIRSRYYQQIKQGFAYKFSEFLAKHRANVIENLDLGGILSRFSRLDSDPVILPMELMRGNQSLFWAEYEGRLGFLAPDDLVPDSDVINTNVTLTNTMTIHRKLNAVLERLEASVSRGTSEDRAAVIKALQNAKTWGTRRALTFARADDLAFLTSALGMAKATEPEFYSLDDAFIDEIKQRFIEPLSDSTIFPYPDILASYATNLDVNSIDIL